jgi:hypothetical protein
MTNTRSILVYSLLPVILIVAIVEGANLLLHRMGGYPPADINIDPTQLVAFLTNLQALWGRYLDMVQLLITLLTGVIAVSSGIVRFGGTEPVAERRFYAAGMASLLIALTMSVLWRVDAQLLMEMEIFGDPRVAMAMYKANGVLKPFTTSFDYLYLIRAYGDAAKIFMFGTAYGLIAGLAFLARFAFSNMPEASRIRNGIESDSPSPV